MVQFGSLGNKVLQQVCRDLPALRAAGIQGRIAVNISSHQFYDQAAVETWFAIMQEHDVSPAEFIFEITESMVAARPRAPTQNATFFA